MGLKEDDHAIKEFELDILPCIAVPALSHGLKLFQSVLHSAVRRASSGKTLGIVPNKEAYKKLQKKQAVMCLQDGLLVWQKSFGYFDGLLRYLTYGMLTVGTGIVVMRTYEMSYPAKKG